MGNLHIRTLVVLFLLQSYVMGQKPCDERNITGAVGGAITLHVRHTGTEIISWSLLRRGILIAQTRPQGSIDIQDPSYDGRLSSTSDGSLILNGLKEEDRGTYRSQFRTDQGIIFCDYHLTVFRNITTDNITISSSVQNNITCEVNLTCSVNTGDVNISWRSVNSSDISLTPTISVPHSDINFTYTCTAGNPVSEASKDVHPREYCKNGHTSTMGTDGSNRAFYIGVPLALGMLICAIFLYRISRCCKTKSERGNKEKLLAQESNDYEFNGEEPLMYIGDSQTMEQKNGREKKKNKPGVSDTTTVYSQIGFSQASGRKQSPANDSGISSLYSTVEKVQNKNGQRTKDPTVESLYDQVQLPRDNKSQQIPSAAANEEPSTTAKEPSQEKLKDNKGQQKLSAPANQKPLATAKAAKTPENNKEQNTPSTLANGKPLTVAKNSAEDNKDQQNLSAPANREPSATAKEPPQEKTPKNNKEQKTPSTLANGKPLSVPRKPPREVLNSAEDNKDQQNLSAPANREPSATAKEPPQEKTPKNKKGQRTPSTPANEEPSTTAKEPSQDVLKQPAIDEGQQIPPTLANGEHSTTAKESAQGVLSSTEINTDQQLSSTPANGEPSTRTEPPQEELESPETQKIPPTPANKKVSKAAPHKVLEVPKGKNGQKTLSEGANVNLPFRNEPCYSTVQLPKAADPAKVCENIYDEVLASDPKSRLQQASSSKYRS